MSLIRGTVYTGIIIENTLDSTNSAILVKPDNGSGLNYDAILFELTDSQKEWVNKTGSRVQIVCYNSFQESLPPVGGLVSISEIGNTEKPELSGQLTVKKSLMDLVLEFILYRRI